MKASSRGERGFTLVELLVVVSIIFILSSLLAPALARAKGSSRSIRCQTNLRQVGVALNIYTTDFNAYPLGGPVPFTTNLTELEGWWLLALHKNVRSNLNVLICPQSSMYVYNSFGTGFSMEAQKNYGLGGMKHQRVRVSQVRAPSEMLAIAEGMCWSIVGFGRPGAPAGTYYDPNGPHPTRRSNGVFCDGHVESSASDRMEKDEWGEFLPNEGHARRWNYDNEPHPETWR